MKKRLLHCLVTLSLFGSVSAYAAAPIQWSGNSHWYQTVNPSPGVTWQQAKTLAEASTFLGVSGHLATITSSAENAFVQSILPVGAPTYGYYLGGSQAPGSPEPASGWGWVTAEPFSYTNWNGGEPNDGFAGSPQGFLWMWSDFAQLQSGGTWVAGKWDDTWDNFSQYEGAPNSYVIEYVPEPSSFSLLSGAGALVAIVRARRKRS